MNRAVPTKLKRLRGTARKDRVPENEPEPDADEKLLMEPPDEISDKAKKHWRKIARELYDAGLLTNLDRDALMMYCQSYAEWVEATEMIRKYGPVIMINERTIERVNKKTGERTIEKAGGQPAQNPAWLIKDRCEKTMKAILKEFGMSPSSRATINAEPRKKPTNKNRFARFGKQKSA